MHEYKVEQYKFVDDVQENMNRHAKWGWRVISVSPICTTAGIHSIIVTYEREVK